MKLRSILMLMMLLITCSVYSQQHYPVQVQSSIIFPSAFLTDYSDPSNINVRVFLSDLNKDNYKILLKINLTDRKSINLVSIRGIELTLEKGQVYFLNDMELAALFDPKNLKSKDNNIAVVDESLPEGIYHLSFEAVDARVPDVVVSNPKSDFTVFSVNRYDPPMLTSPVDKQSFDLQTINQNVFFNWQPRHVSFSPQQKIKYNFRLIKVVPIDRNPYDAMKNTPANTSNSIIDVQGLDFPVFIYTPADVPLEEGNVYAWQVTAYEETSGGKTTSQRFKNLGASEVFTFSIKENCQPVSVIAEPKVINNDLIALSWGEDPSHVMYEVAYRPANTSLPWTPVLTANNTLNLDRMVLEEGVMYEYTIRAQCKTWTQPSFGGTFILETPNCIAPEPIMADSEGEKLKISWEPVAGVSAYRFQYKLLNDPSAEYIFIELAGTSSEYSVDKNNYLIKIDALCGTEVGEGKAYEVLQDDNGLVSPCPIPKPFQFMAQRIKGDTASLKWNVNNVNKIYSGYKISWWPKDSADYKTTQAVDVPQLIGTKIYDDQLYAYQITFQCGTKESVTPVGMFRIEGENATVIKEEGTADCFPPAVLQGEARSTTSALFEWSKVNGAEDYQLFYAPKGEKVFKTFNTISKSAVLKDLEESKQYQFVVRCRCGGKYSIFSDTAVVDLSKGKVNAACDSSQYFISDAQSTTNIRLCWKYNPSHTGYKITYRDENQDPSSEYTIAYTNLDTLNNLKEGDTLKYTVQNLNSGTAYIFRLQALCGTNESLKNAPLKVSTQPDTKSTGNCEGSPLCDRTSTTPLTSLSQGDTIHCADYQIKITEVSSSNTTNGIYSGKGTMVMPIAGIGDFVSVNVSFENVKINDKPNSCVYDGTVKIENVNASVLPEELRDKVKEMEGKITELIDDANKLLDDISKGITDAKDATQDAIDYFQGGNNVGSVKDGNLGEKEVNVDIPKGTTTASVTATSVTIGGETITVSSFPVLIKDKDGEIFQVTSTGKVTHVGTYDSTLVKDENQKLEEGSVVFEENTSAKYDFDAYKAMYAKSEQISRKYEVLNGSYYVPSKLLLPGETDVVNAKLLSTAYKAENIKFANGKGAVFNHTSAGNTFTITISGGPAGDAQEVYAWYVNGTEKKIIGKLLVPSYTPKHKNVVIIPVGKSTVDVAKYQKGLNDAYEKLGITYTVTLDESFRDNLDWDMDGDGKVQAKGSKLISNDYQGEEAAMVEAYVAAKGGEGNIDPETGYFFAVYEASNLEDNLLGKMPAQEQFGFLYVGGASEASLVRTIAHEIGHGAYHLEHTFNSIYLGDNSKSTTANLMDYKDGYELWKYQWDIVHDPGHVWGILKRDRDAEAIGFGIAQLKQYVNSDGTFKYINKDGTYSFLSPSGKVITLPSNTSSVLISTADPLYFVSSGKMMNSVAPVGSLIGFTIDNKDYYSLKTVSGVVRYYCEKKDRYYKDIYSKNNTVSFAIVGIPFYYNDIGCDVYKYDLPNNSKPNSDVDQFGTISSSVFTIVDNLISTPPSGLPIGSNYLDFLISQESVNREDLDFVWLNPNQTFTLSPVAKAYLDKYKDYTKSGSALSPIIISNAYWMSINSSNDVNTICNEAGIDHQEKYFEEFNKLILDAPLKGGDYKGYLQNQYNLQAASKFYNFRNEISRIKSSATISEEVNAQISNDNITADGLIALLNGLNDCDLETIHIDNRIKAINLLETKWGENAEELIIKLVYTTQYNLQAKQLATRFFENNGELYLKLINRLDWSEYHLYVTKLAEILRLDFTGTTDNTLSLSTINTQNGVTGYKFEFTRNLSNNYLQFFKYHNDASFVGLRSQLLPQDVSLIDFIEVEFPNENSYLDLYQDKPNSGEKLLIPAFYLAYLLEKKEFDENIKWIRVGANTLAILASIPSGGQSMTLVQGISIALAGTDIYMAYNEAELNNTPNGKAIVELWNLLQWIDVGAGVFNVGTKIDNATKGIYKKVLESGIVRYTFNTSELIGDLKSTFFANKINAIRQTVWSLRLMKLDGFANILYNKVLAQLEAEIIKSSFVSANSKATLSFSNWVECNVNIDGTISKLFDIEASSTGAFTRTTPVNVVSEGDEIVGRFLELNYFDNITGRIKTEEFFVAFSASTKKAYLAKTLSNRLTSFKNLETKINSLDNIAKGKFFEDFANAKDDVLRELNSNVDLVDSWNILKNTGLKTDVKWLEKISDLKKAGFELIEEGAGVKILRQGDEIAKIADDVLQVKIPHGNGWAKQVNTPDALKILDDVTKSKKVYKIGTLDVSETTGAQYWSPENPLSFQKIEDYAEKYGLPVERLKGDNKFIIVGEIGQGELLITRPAVPYGGSKGGGIEIVTPSGAVKMESFHILKVD